MHRHTHMPISYDMAWHVFRAIIHLYSGTIFPHRLFVHRVQCTSVIWYPHHPLNFLVFNFGSFFCRIEHDIKRTLLNLKPNYFSIKCNENNSRPMMIIAIVVVFVFAKFAYPTPHLLPSINIGYIVGNWSININYCICLFILNECMHARVCAYMYDVNLQNKQNQAFKVSNAHYSIQSTHTHAHTPNDTFIIIPQIYLSMCKKSRKKVLR